MGGGLTNVGEPGGPGEVDLILRPAGVITRVLTTTAKLGSSGAHGDGNDTWATPWMTSVVGVASVHGGFDGDGHEGDLGEKGMVGGGKGGVIGGGEFQGTGNTSLGELIGGGSDDLGTGLEILQMSILDGVRMGDDEAGVPHGLGQGTGRVQMILK